MVDYSAVTLSWFQAAMDLTPSTEEEHRRLQEVWQEREQLLQMRDLLQVQLVRLISSTTRSHEEVQALVHERRWLLNELAAFQSTDEVDMQMNGCRPVSPGPEEVPWIRPCSQRSQHRLTNSTLSTPRAAPTPVSWSAMGSIPGRHQQPGPEEIPWPQTRPQLVQRTRQTGFQSDSAPTPAGNTVGLPTAGLEQEQGQSRFSRPSPPRQLHRMVQPTQAPPTRDAPCESTENGSPRRPMRNVPSAPAAPPQPPHPQVVLAADLPSGRTQSARNRQSQRTHANQRLQAAPAQRPVARNAISAPSASIRHNGGTIGFILPPLPTAAPAA